MKYLKNCPCFVICFVFFILLAGVQVYAQHTTRATKGPGSKTTAGGGAKVVMNADQVIKLRKLSGLGRRGYVKSPEFRTTVGSTVVAEKDWVQISLEYATAPEWIDELTFQFYAVSSAMIDGVKTYSFYKSAVRYADVERGNHVCTMYLRPSAVKRFGDLFAVAVEVSYKGNVVDEMAEEGQKMPPKWWKDPVVVENPNTVTREGYFINRSLSPFSLISCEGYEFIK